MRLGKIILFIMSMILLASIAAAQNNHLHLLAVSEKGNNTLTGGVADLFLEIREGKGNVFIDTYPLSKFDTQLSIRFAKEMACKFSEIDCSEYDFMYTIRAKSRIVGGPSGGAAIAAITYSQLNDLDLNDSVAITGTINSGRLVGNVGGIKQKIEGASEYGIKKVLIPLGESIQKQEDNTTLDMVEYGSSLNVTVVPVSDLEDALFHFTGKNLHKNITEFEVDKNYQEIMRKISDKLCNRSYGIIKLIQSTSIVIDNSSHNGRPLNATYNTAISLIENAEAAYDNGTYYSSASQCYGANNFLYFIYLIAQNNSDEFYSSKINLLEGAITLYEGNLIGKNLTSIPELQTALIIRQRLDEAKNYLDKAREYDFNNSNSSKSQRENMIHYIALTVERLYTTQMWAMLFELPGEEYFIDLSILESSCQNIINDALARIEYAQLYLPGRFAEQAKKLEELNQKSDPEYCISKASQIKADVNALIGSIGLLNEDISDYTRRKLAKATEVMAEETMNSRFPILGYSYYEYAKVLADSDPVSALIYAEYALEFSNLDLYLNEPQLSMKQTYISFNNENSLSLSVAILTLLSIFVGVLLGVKVTDSYYRKKYKLAKKKHHKNK